MILTLFIVLLFLGLIALGIGYATGERYHALVGFVFLFLLSTVILTGNLTYQSGSVEVTTYTYQATVLQNTTHTISDTYVPFADKYSHTFGYYMAIITGFGGIMLFFVEKKEREERT